MSEIVLEAKKALRALVLRNRSELLAKETEDAFANCLIELSTQRRLQKIGCYLSFGSEPATGSFVSLAGSFGITIYCPRVEEDGQMVMAALGTKTSVHKLGFREPDGEVIHPDELGLIIVPALAIDFAGKRLGRGAGFFDRYLMNYKGPTVGLVFDSEFIKTVPSLTHDQPVSQVVTQSRTISIPFDP